MINDFYTKVQSFIQSPPLEPAERFRMKHEILLTCKRAILKNQKKKKAAQQLSTLSYPSRKVSEFAQSTYVLFARQDGKKSIASYQKDTKIEAEPTELCGHLNAELGTATHKGKVIQGLICYACAV